MVSRLREKDRYNAFMTPPSQALDFETLPGGDLIRQGLADLQEDIESVPALLLYNALIRKLVSFNRAAQCARWTG